MHRHMSATVEISEANGEYTAVDSETGAAGSGKTRAMALAALAVRLGAEENASNGGERTELQSLATRMRERFEEENVTEGDIQDAITWARSE